uniref:HTH transcriptional regulator, GntR n=1 Tax=Ralstonia syzygii R24 TaxID=907261 RepID=G3A4E3_9RALS|nr:HTH transcriptional regulator, GntR [Ralstonia syzygii R24]
MVAALRQSILAGKIPPGTQLVESRLSAQFGVSRTLLREAVRELIETGILVNRPYAGTFVADINETVLLDVYEARRVIERQAYIRIWPNRGPSFRRDLMARYDELMQAIDSGELNAEIAAEAHFHGLVYERCGNHLFLEFWRQMTQKIQLGFAICQISHAPKADFLDNHHDFMACALGDSLDTMLAELDAHLDRGIATIRHTSWESVGQPAPGRTGAREDAGKETQ